MLIAGIACCGLPVGLREQENSQKNKRQRHRSIVPIASIAEIVSVERAPGRRATAMVEDGTVKFFAVQYFHALPSRLDVGIFDVHVHVIYAHQFYVKFTSSRRQIDVSLTCTLRKIYAKLASLLRQRETCLRGQKSQNVSWDSQNTPFRRFPASSCSLTLPRAPTYLLSRWRKASVWFKKGW